MPLPSQPRSRRRRILIGSSVSLATLAILFTLAEIGARLLVPEDVLSPYKPVYRRDPIAGYTLQPGYRGYSLGAWLEINSLGYRGPEWPLAKPPNTCRIALIGDSHAFGFGVPFASSVGEVLARLLDGESSRRHEVLNFAAPGLNSRQQLAVLRERAFAYAPDLVIVLPCSNDDDPPLWADDEGYLHWAPADELPPETTRVEGQPIVNPPRFKLLEHSRLYMYAKLVWARSRLTRGIEQNTARTRGEPWLAPLPPAPVPTPTRLVATVYEPLAAMVSECRARQVPVVMALFAPPADYRVLARNLHAATGVPVLELLQLFPEATSWADLLAKFSIGWDSHLNAVAHERWARALAELIREHGWLR